MTRETKIGLLVGLLFIVAFGLVLSGIMPKEGSSAFPPESQALPGGPVSTRPLTVPSEAVVDPMRGMVSEGVLTFDNMAGVRPAVMPGSVTTEVVRPGSGESVPAVPTEVAQVSPPVPPPHMTTPGSVRTVTFETPDEVLSDLRRASSSQLAAGGQLSPPGGSVERPAPVGPVTGQAQAGAADGQKYTVKAGDTLYGIARLLYGPAHASQYTRILDANRSVISSPASLKAGMVLTIPPLDVAGTPSVAPVPPAVMPTPVTPARPTVAPTRGGDPIIAGATPPGSTPRTLAATERPAPTKKTYTVQKGDTLSGIARENVISVNDLIKLNDIKNPNALQIGQVLVLKN